MKKYNVIPLDSLVIQQTIPFLSKANVSSLQQFLSTPDGCSLVELTHQGKCKKYLVNDAVKVSAFRQLKQFISLTEFYTAKGSHNSTTFFDSVEKAHTIVNTVELSQFMLNQINTMPEIFEIAEDSINHIIDGVKIPKGSSGTIVALGEKPVQKTLPDFLRNPKEQISTDFRKRD